MKYVLGITFTSHPNEHNYVSTTLHIVKYTAIDFKEYLMKYIWNIKRDLKQNDFTNFWFVEKIVWRPQIILDN